MKLGHRTENLHRVGTNTARKPNPALRHDRHTPEPEPVTARLPDRAPDAARRPLQHRSIHTEKPRTEPCGKPQRARHHRHHRTPDRHLANPTERDSPTSPTSPHRQLEHAAPQTALHPQTQRRRRHRLERLPEAGGETRPRLRDKPAASPTQTHAASVQRPGNARPGRNRATNRREKNRDPSPKSVNSTIPSYTPTDTG